jgi:xanthine dehydrogenase accessory factor
MAHHHILIEAGSRAARGEPFVLATVVRRRAPSSARPAQKALVLPDGSLSGWIGGSCIEPVLRREGLEALRDGLPRRVVLAPDPGEEAGLAGADPDVHAHPMTCHSGGTVEIFLEPYLPAPRLELYGDSPIAEALAAMAAPLGWRVERIEEPGEEPAAEREPGGDGGAAGGSGARLAVVATMGVWDESAAARALEGGAAYVGLVASPRRTAEVRRNLTERGVPEEALGRLVGPAGLDLGAETPAEIAVSILAQIVSRRELARPAAPGAPGQGEAGARGAPGAATPEAAIDPVCGMDVDPATARFMLEHGGRTYYFCCEGCREKFRADPAAYGAA